MDETAYFGAGCYWGAELAFSKVSGVITTEVGFSNIVTSKGKESRVETVKIEFDPSFVSFSELIMTFWSTHDPSAKQNESETYVEKSVLFGVNEKQLQLAEISLKNQKRNLKNKQIYTLVKPFISYNKAPEKDQQYYSKNNA